MNISMKLTICRPVKLIGLILLFVLSPTLTGIMLASVPAVVIGAVAYGSFEEHRAAVSKALATAGGVASEVLGSVRTVRSFAKEARIERREFH